MVRRLAWLFGAGGTLILVALTVALLSSETRVRIPSIAAMVTFCALVLSYLGGIEGGLALREERSDARTRAIAFGLGGLPPLAAWALLLWLPSSQMQLGVFIALFIAVWGADLWLAKHGLIPPWFVDMRTAATVIVCITLGFAIWLI